MGKRSKILENLISDFNSKSTLKKKNLRENSSLRLVENQPVKHGDPNE